MSSASRDSPSLRRLGYGGPLLAVDAVHWGESGAESRREQVVEETPVVIVYNRVPHVVMMATPENLEDFALGFSIPEELIRSPADLLAVAAKSQKRTLTPDRRTEAGYFYRSDHFNFAKAGVPALYVKSGTTLREGPPEAGLASYDEYYAKRYHKPDDEYSETWDVGGSVEDLRLLFEVGTRVAYAETWPAWREGNEFRATREKSAASRKPDEE